MLNHGQGNNRNLDENGEVIEREFTVSFNSKNITENYNNIQPQKENYREDSDSFEFEMFLI